MPNCHQMIPNTFAEQVKQVKQSTLILILIHLAI